jgi:hypothetical protein
MAAWCIFFDYTDCSPITSPELAMLENDRTTETGLDILDLIRTFAGTQPWTVRTGLEFG